MKKAFILTLLTAVMISGGIFYYVSDGEASSHREAPIISADPQADNTDVYAFVAADAPTALTIVASFNPFEEPAGGTEL